MKAKSLWGIGGTVAAFLVVGQAGAQQLPPTALQAWDAFVVLPWRLGVDGRVEGCRDPRAKVGPRGVCTVDGWVAQFQGPPERFTAQQALERFLGNQLGSDFKPVLVAVGPSLEGSKYPSIGASSFIAYYRVVDVRQATRATEQPAPAQREPSSSEGYRGRVLARIKPNILYASERSGQNEVTMQMKLAPDGTVLEARSMLSKGDPEWAAAVSRAIKRTEVLPRDTDGRVPSRLELTFRSYE